MTGADATSALIMGAGIAIFVVRAILQRIHRVEREMERTRRLLNVDHIRVAALGEQVELLRAAQRRRPPRADCQGERHGLVVIEGGKES